MHITNIPQRSFAANSAGRSEGSIGCILPWSSGPYYRAILGALHQVIVQQHKRNLIIFQTTVEAVVSTRLGWAHIAGWVVVLPSKGANLLVQAGQVVVTIGEREPGITAVVCDNRGGMRAIMAHLIGLGHQRIAFVGTLANRDIGERYEAYCDELRAHGLPLDPQLVVNAPDEIYSGGRYAARVLLASRAAYTAIVAGTDMNAIALIEMLQAAGRHVPRDIAVVGFDDLPQGQNLTPPLTTVRQQFDVLGRVAAQQLLAILAGAPDTGATISVPTNFIIRKSSGGSAPVPARFTLPAHDAWATVLQQWLIGVVLSPFEPLAGGSATSTWPEVATLTDALAAALAGAPLPTDEAMCATWRGALHHTTDLNVLHRVIETLDHVGQTLIAHLPVGAAPHRQLGLLMRQLSWQLTCAYAKLEGGQRLMVEQHSTILEILRSELLGADLATVTGLEWLRHTTQSAGTLALWRDDTYTALTMAHSYRQATGVSGALAQTLPAQAFPPLDLLGAEAHQPQVITLIALQTQRHRGGFLALAAPGSAWHGNEDDMPTVWASLLTSRLDNAVMVDELRTALNEVAERSNTQSHLLKELEAQRAIIAEIANQDSLTQIANRRRFDTYLEQIWKRLLHEQQPLALILCDIDYFKQYNDLYGHQRGDECLQRIASALQRAVSRPDDLVARYGGEEFALILPYTDATGVAAVARLIQNMVQQCQLPHAQSLVQPAITMSMGLAHVIPSLDRTSKTLVATADRALYAAKKQGRNRWIYSSGQYAYDLEPLPLLQANDY